MATAFPTGMTGSRMAATVGTGDTMVTAGITGAVGMTAVAAGTTLAATTGTANAVTDARHPGARPFTAQALALYERGPSASPSR
jgi:hypothetical protein